MNFMTVERNTAMKGIGTLLIVWSLGLLLVPGACFAQMYRVIDLGTLGGTSSTAQAINEVGQVVGVASLSGDTVYHAFRTTLRGPIKPTADDLGVLIGTTSTATGINIFGEVVGQSIDLTNPHASRAFRTRPNRPINPATDDLGTLGGDMATANGINVLGQVVGISSTGGSVSYIHAFRTAPNRPINPATDDLGTLDGTEVLGSGINAFGQVVGTSSIGDSGIYHAFRTAPNRPIDPTTDDLGTLGGQSSSASHINIFGQVVGNSNTLDSAVYHAFRTAPNRPINPATDDLGTLGGTLSTAEALDDYSQVVGWAQTSSNAAQHAFLFSGGRMSDLNSLIPAGSDCELTDAVDINDAGQIAANGNCNGQQHAVRLTPIYNALADADGSSAFRGTSEQVRVKFTLTRDGIPTCTLPPATIVLTKAVGNTIQTADEATYSTNSDGDSNLRINASACQYVYKPASSSLGNGTYRADIGIDGIFVGHAVFAIK
jgi:probable HAF family extracellular repeat protein